MKYRPEIDGLRACAVVPVILFHAGFELFSGGFVGVDIFFVISGFLITTIIVEDIENGRFSIVNFYERRARRILPALFFVILCCIPFAWMWMDAQIFLYFSRSLVAVSLFASNLLFWREGGYFGAAAENKPLLHTWSLAVEEQYYIMFPIFLLLVWRYGKNRVFWSIVVLAAISLVLSEWAWRNHRIANFYLAPTRAWELLAGSITAFIVQKRGVGKNNVLVLVGLAAIIFSVFSYDASTPFPSVYALVPVLGVVLLLLYADKETFVAKFLSTKPFVGIGLISYSAYLWHQPLFAFARIKSTGEPTTVLIIVLCVMSLILAWISWKYIEQPFRIKGLICRRKIFQNSALAIILSISLGLFGHFNKGFSIVYATTHKNLSVKPLLNNNFIVLGDSHGSHLISGIEQITSGTVVNYTETGCIPFRNVDRYDSRFVKGACAIKINQHLDKIQNSDPNAVIILSSMGPIYLEGTAFKGKDKARVTGLGIELISDKSITNKYSVYEIGMRNTLEELSVLNNSKILFAIDIPELGIDRGCQIESKQIFVTHFFKLSDFVETLTTDKCFVSRKDYDLRSYKYKKLVYKVLEDFPNVTIFDPTNVFCDDDICKGVSKKFGFLYSDIDHLSRAGSLYFAIQLAEALEGAR